MTIKPKEKICKCGCGVKGRIFSKGMLLPCWKKNFQKPISKMTDKKKLEKKVDTEQTKKLHEWFRQIWDKTEDKNGYCYCYETGLPMYRHSYRNNSICYHHILEKSKYPQFAFEEWNVVIVLPIIHSQVHSDIDKTPRIKKLTQELKEKY